MDNLDFTFFLATMALLGITIIWHSTLGKYEELGMGKFSSGLENTIDGNVLVQGSCVELLNMIFSNMGIREDSYLVHHLVVFGFWRPGYDY